MPARTYPPERYAEVADLLVEQLGATVALTGAEHERDLVERIHRGVRRANRPAVLRLAGALEFDQFCGLIETADLTITNNTGPMHIAAAVKTPVVALFALTNPPEQWRPWRVPHRLLYHEVACRLCYCRVCPYGHECLRLVTPRMVAESAGELLSGAALRAIEVGGWQSAIARPPSHQAGETGLASAQPEERPVGAASTSGAWELGRSWKLGTDDLDSEEVGWRLGAGWRLGDDQ
jgi:hypothetical protein